MKIHTSLERFGEEMREIFELEVRVAFGRTVGFHGRFRPIPATAAAEVGRETSAVVCWFVWHQSRRSAPSEAAGATSGREEGRGRVAAGGERRS